MVPPRNGYGVVWLRRAHDGLRRAAGTGRVASTPEVASSEGVPKLAAVLASGLWGVGFGGQPVEHGGDRRDFDPGLGGFNGVFEIAFAETAVSGEPGEGALDDPAGVDGDELVARRILDDVDTQPQAGHSAGQALVGGVAAHQAQQAVGEPGSTEQLVATGNIGDIGRGDGHGDDQTEAVNQDMAFRPRMALPAS